MTHPTNFRRDPLLIHAAGAISLLAWVALAVRSGGGPHGLPWAMLGAQGLAWAALLVAFTRASAVPLRAVWIWAVLFRCAGLFATPVLEDDWFRFLWDGRMFALTGNPYATVPLASFGDSGVPEPFQRVLDQVNHPDVPTIYGPVCQAAFAASYAVAPGRLWPWKVILLAADLLAIFMIRRLARGWKPALFFAWCPLLIFETSFNAHPESLAIAFLLGAIAARRSASTAVLCAVAIGAKLFAFLLVPLILWSLPRRAWLIFGATLALLYAPFWLQGSAADLAGLRTMAAEWEFNSSVFALLRATISEQAAESLCTSGFIAIWLGLAWLWMRRRAATPDAMRELVRFSGLIFGSFLLLSPVVNPWYLLWLLPGVAVSPSPAGVVALAAVSLSYLTGLNLAHPALRNFEHPGWLRPLEYGAIAVALLYDWCRRITARAATAR